MTALTERQQKALAEALTEAHQQHGIELDPWSLTSSWWTTRFEDEIRPGRGRDLTTTWCDADHIVVIRIDVYGSTSLAIGDLTWTHDSEDEDCGCAACAAEQQRNDEADRRWQEAHDSHHRTDHA